MTGQDRNQGLFIADAIRQIFGINSPIFFPYGKNVPLEPGQFRDIVLLPEESDGEEIATKSEFGLPVMAPITFEAGEYNSYDRRTAAIVKRQMPEFTLPLSSIVEFQAPNDVIKTKLQGGSGTVKEFYSLDDWRITIRGIALKSRTEWWREDAHEQIERLIQWRGLCDPIAVQSPIFRRKGIYNIVIEDISIRPVVARWDAIPFQIEAVSDEPIELYML